MMNSSAFDLNMIQYLLDPISVAEANIAILTGAKNKTTLEAIGLLRKRVNFFTVYNLVDLVSSNTHQIEATQKLCIDRYG